MECSSFLGVGLSYCTKIYYHVKLLEFGFFPRPITAIHLQNQDKNEATSPFNCTKMRLRHPLTSMFADCKLQCLLIVNYNVC